MYISRFKLYTLIILSLLCHNQVTIDSEHIASEHHFTSTMNKK